MRLFWHLSPLFHVQWSIAVHHIVLLFFLTILVPLADQQASNFSLFLLRYTSVAPHLSPLLLLAHQCYPAPVVADERCPNFTISPAVPHFFCSTIRTISLVGLLLWFLPRYLPIPVMLPNAFYPAWRLLLAMAPAFVNGSRPIF